MGFFADEEIHYTTGSDGYGATTGYGYAGAGSGAGATGYGAPSAAGGYAAPAVASAAYYGGAAPALPSGYGAPSSSSYSSSYSVPSAAGYASSRYTVSAGDYTVHDLPAPDLGGYSAAGGAGATGAGVRQAQGRLEGPLEYGYDGAGEGGVIYVHKSDDKKDNKRLPIYSKVGAWQLEVYFSKDFCIK